MNGAPQVFGLKMPKNRSVLKEDLRKLMKALPHEEYRTLRISRTGEEERFLEDLIDEVMLGEGPGESQIDTLLRDPTVTEIMVNGPKEMFVEREGCLERLESQFRDTDHLMAVVERLLTTVSLSVNESNPCCDASLPDGSRINVIIAPLVLVGPVVTIRRKLRHWSMKDYMDLNSISEQAAQFLEVCVKAKVNMLVSGGTSTGKTAIVAVLSEYIPQKQRVITIENIPELDLGRREHWVRLVAKSPNLEGRGEIPLRALVKNALRMRPDRIILGEARGGEALDVVQAMHTGHDGIITVLHASSAEAALERLETLVLMSGLDLPPTTCRLQIARVVDLIVHMSRYADGSRRVMAITQVLGAGPNGFQVEDLFTFNVEGFSPDGKLQGACRYTGVRPKFLWKFHLNNVEVPPWVTTQ